MRITTTFGAPAPGFGGSDHHGVESASVLPIVPSKRSCAAMRIPFASRPRQRRYWQYGCQYNGEPRVHPTLCAQQPKNGGL